MLALGTIVFLSGAALATPVPDAGGSRTVDEDASTTYTGTDSGDGITWGWVFDGSTIIDGMSVSYTFDTPGLHSAAFFADDGAGNNITDSVTVTVTDLTAPTGSGTVPSSANEDASVAFSSSAITDNDPNFASDRRDYWTFTDGTAKNLSGTSPSYTFNTPGTFAITLTVMDATGNKLTQAFTITVADITAPTPSTGGAQSPNEDTVVTFDGSGSSDNDPNFATNGRYFWTFSDQGTSRSLSGKTATYTFATPGSYLVTLLVLDAAGNFASAQVTITVKDVTAPVAVITGGSSQSFNEDIVKTLDASGSTDNDPAFGTTGNYTWTFTDVTAKTLYGVSASYTFANPGTYTITLTVKDAGANSGTATSTFTVRDVTSPVASWTISGGLTFNEDLAVTLDGTASTDNVGISSYAWAISDTSGTVARTGSTTSYTWATPGTYSVSLTTTDAAGNSNVKTQSVTVRDITAPTGTGSVPSSANEDISVAFSASGVTDNDLTFSSTRRDYWTFTDGTAKNLSGSSQSYVFANPGTFSITLLTMDSAGNRFTSTFNITIADVTPTVPAIVATSQAQSRQQFSSMTHQGTATDNVAVTTYGWAFTENSVAQNITGQNMTRTWSYTGTYTLTFWARDAAGNVGTITTTFTVTPDITAPVVTITIGPTVGDDQTAVSYTATVSDNNPACITGSCTFVWQVDGVTITSGTVASSSIVFTTTLVAGRHVVSPRVTDPAANTGFATRTVDIDQLINVDTTWSGVNVILNNNIRVQNGATFAIVNSTVQNSTNGLTYKISLISGRLVIEGSTFLATSTTVGFVINATRAALPASVTVLINSSTIGGLYDFLTVINGTLAIRDSTINNVRGSNLGAIYTWNSNTYLTNVAVVANTLTNTYGIRADFDSFVTVFQTREIVLQNVQINSTLTAIRTFGDQVSGTILVNIRDTQIRSGGTLTTVRGIDQYFWRSTGVITNTFSNVDSQAVRGGGLYAVYQTFNGTHSYNITDSNFSGSLSGNGTTIQVVDSSSQFAYAFNNVAASTNSLIGFSFRFTNQTANIGSWNQGTLSMRTVSAFNNTLDGVQMQQFNTRLNATVDIQGSSLSFNKRHGLSIDQQQGNRSGLIWNLQDSWLNANTGNGVMYFWNIQRVNVSMNFLRTNVENNTLNGMNFTWFQGQSFEGYTRGNFYVNLTSSKFNTNTRHGFGMMTNNSYSNNVFFLNMLDSSMDFNKMNGFDMINNYAAQSYVWNGIYFAPYSDFFISLERSSFSNNVINGAFTSGTYCAYGTTNSTFPSACMISFNISRSHIDNNNQRGLYTYWYYVYYASQQGYFNINNDSTVNNNGYAGINEYHYYTYMYNVVAGRQTETIYNIVNASFNFNGRTNTAEGFGIYQYLYYDYYLMGHRDMNTNNASFIANKNSGIRPYIYYVYYGNPIIHPNIFNSTFTDNGGAGYDPYYYYTYQCGICVQENVEQNTFLRNAGGALNLGFPQSAGRYFSGYNLRYVNNIIDQTPRAAISTYVTYSYTTYYYSGNNQVNISGNRITNTQGAAISFALDPPQTGGTVWVDFSNNYVNTSTDTSGLTMPGSTSVSHSWTARGNTFINTSTSALVFNMVNFGSGNTGGLTFEANTFKDTQGTAFALIQSNIALSGMSIKDCVFINSQIGLDLTGINGVVRNATFQGSIKSDIQLTNGALEIHQTPVNPDLLAPIGSASFSVFFTLKIYVVWAGSLRPATGSIVELADALGTTFFVGSVVGAEGLPEFESLSYTKNAQGVLGRSPFRASVNYFELSQTESIPLPSDRIVNILLRDDVPPTMVLASPASGFATRGDTILVEGTAYDSHSGFTYDQNDSAVAAQFVSIGTGSEPNAPDDTVWTTPEIIQASTGEIAFRLTLTSLPESVRYVYVKIHDEAGNYYTRVVPVVLDKTPPIVTLLEQPPLITRANTVHIVAETEIGTTVFVNGIAPPELLVRPDGVHVFFQMDISIIEGPNTITVMAMDALRNQGRVTVTITADREAPYVVINSPEQDQLVRGTDVMVMGHAADRNGVSVTLNGLNAPLDANGNFSFPIPIAGDVTRIEAIATDGAGNTQILVRVVRFDEIPPWVTLENPAEGSLVGTTEVPVSGVVEQGSILTINGETVDAPHGVFSRRILLVEGDNVIHLEATDSAGNKATLDRAVTVDTHRPTILVTSVSDNTLWAHPTIPLAGTVTDDHTATLTLDGTPVDLTDGRFAIEVELLEGTNVLHLIAMDAAGNTERMDIRIVRDTTAPVVAPNIEGLVADAGQYYTTQEAVSVTGIAEPGSIVQVCYTQEIGGVACNVVPLASDGSFRTFVDLLPDQKQRITIVGTDAAGNVATRDLTVTRQAQVVVEAQQPVAAYGLFAVALGVLGLGAYFLVMSRRRGARVEALDHDAAYLAPAPMEPAPQHIDLAPAPAIPAPAPVIEQPSITSVPSDEQLQDAAPVVAPPVVESKPKMRPMRRRPVEGAGAGAEGLSDKGTSAEGEAGPTESQTETKKEGEQ